MKVTVLSIVATISLVLAEPPVPSSQYLPSNQYLPPSSQYGAPSGPRPFTPPSNHYGAPAHTQAVIKPNTEYGAPSSQYGAPSSKYGAPSSQYGAPSSQYGAPSSKYGAPSSQYGAPSGGYEYQEPTAPANYEFEYHVQDEESGNDFGHQEKREGDVAEGKYFVLLPDGRLQTVEYTADQEGYKPKISYQQVGGGYPASNGGYQY